VNLDANQLVVSVLVLFLTASACAVIVFQRTYRRVAYALLCGCALVAGSCWFNFGRVHTIFVDVAPADSHGRAPKEERHQPFHLHEFFHYYIGAKYFREAGYLELYDCAALADKEIADEEHAAPRISGYSGYVRDLFDVLKDKTYDQALSDCREHAKFTPERWASFKQDLRELHRLVPDGWWNSVVYDAGFNPPPSWIVVGSAVANAIPIRAGSVPTYLLATGLDMALLLTCFLVLMKNFGRTAAVIAAIFFGATFIATYGWNGGAFLRFTWITSLVLSLAAMKRGRWALAGALLAASACDRVFPAGFAVGAMVPLAWQAWRSPDRRRPLIRFVAGLGGTVIGLVVVSTIVFGAGAWSMFASRIGRHGDVYYVMHIGLKKLVTFRSWVPDQNFGGHDGLMRFRSWNLRLREEWHTMRFVAIPVQLLASAGAAAAAYRRKPWEAALVCGIVFMFCFALPANYYYVVLALVPAMLVRAAAGAPNAERRMREYGAFVAFGTFWLLTLICSRVWGSDILYNFAMCVGLATFLVVWIAAWAAPPAAWWTAAWDRWTAGVPWLAKAKARGG
jgi:hypothetical protein